MAVFKHAGVCAEDLAPALWQECFLSGFEKKKEIFLNSFLLPFGSERKKQL